MGLEEKARRGGGLTARENGAKKAREKTGELG